MSMAPYRGTDGYTMLHCSLVGLAPLAQLNARPHGGAAVRDPTHQLSLRVLHVHRVLLISAPFMHCVHHHSAEGFAL